MGLKSTLSLMSSLERIKTRASFSPSFFSHVHSMPCPLSSQVYVDGLAEVFTLATRLCFSSTPQTVQTQDENLMY